LRNGDLPVRQDQQQRKASNNDGGASGGFETCTEQFGCISFDVRKLSSAACGGSCPVEICLVIDLNKPTCTKSGTVSHVCDNAGLNGCQYDSANPKDVDGGTSAGSCGLTEYANNGFHSTGKCETVPSGFKMCQTGGAGEILEFIL
jgi:hypothetical protein